MPSPAELRAGLLRRLRRRQVVFRSGLRHRWRRWQACPGHEIRWSTALSLVLVAVTLLSAATAIVVGDVTTTIDAVRLADHGSPGVVSASQVHLTQETSKSGKVHSIVDGVLVSYPGGPALGVELRHVDTHQIFPAAAAGGWVPTTVRTGYQAPFGVHYRLEDGTVVAMADRDIADVRTGALLWRDGVGVLALLLVLAVWWVWSPTRPSGGRRARHARRVTGRR